MPTFVIIGLVLFIAFLIIGSVMNQKQKNYEKSEIDQLISEGFNFDYQINNVNGVLCLDKSKQMIVFINTNDVASRVTNVSRVIKIPLFDLLAFEIIKDGVTVSKKSTTRTVGGALIGGVLTGGVGAIIGGLSGGSTTQEKINAVSLKLLVKNLPNPSYSFFFSGAGIVMGVALKQADFWKDLLTVLMDEIDSEEDKKTPVASSGTGSLSDELKKLHDLKTQGILSEDEFDQQKQKLLSL